MNPETSNRLRTIQDQLIRAAQAWAGGQDYDAALAGELRTEALLIHHAHYCANIPAYRKLAQEEDIGEELDTIAPIKRNLMSTDDIFKSYNQDWLDQRDFERMNGWLGTLYHERVNADMEGVRTIDAWIDRLMAAGITPVYSSGTSGRFSFVPRCDRSWYLFTTAPTCYLGPILMRLGLGSIFQRILMGSATRLLSPATFAGVVKRMGLPGYDGIFLSFRKGNMGIQLVAQELAALFRHTHFLYGIDLSASALRCVTRGARTEEDRNMLTAFTSETVGKKEENYAGVIEQLKRTTQNGRKAFLFGAPYQLKELIELMEAGKEKLSLKKQSVVLFGGGWKSFEGERIERETLAGMISEFLGVPEELIVEGYSMTEINGLMIRCPHGRFHMPPIVEPVILDEELTPLEGNDVTGAFGFLDPFALSYPGSIISGDNVRLVDEACACGFRGPAILQIERAPGREVKGCGGVMASVDA